MNRLLLCGMSRDEFNLVWRPRGRLYLDARGRSHRGHVGTAFDLVVEKCGKVGAQKALEKAIDRVG